MKQHLVGTHPIGPFSDRVGSLIRDVAYIQWDPVKVVAPSHMISLWSRIGNFDWADLDKAMWEEKNIFLHWTPTAVLVLTEDYPVFYSLMKRYPESLGKSWASHIPVARRFIESHQELSMKVLDKLKDGPAEVKQFEGYGVKRKSEDGWSSGNEVTTMLYHLHMLGEVMVSGHAGNQNKWALTGEFLPNGELKKELPPETLERITALKSLKAMGVATELDINRYFVRGRYWNLKDALKGLQDDSEIMAARIDGQKRGRSYFIRKDDARILEGIEKLDWERNLRLISPFDNLITIRERTRRLFNFEYTLEQFVPKEKRKFGTYVMPLLWKDQLVGRIDLKLDRARGTMLINSVHAEPEFEGELEIPANLSRTLEDFSRFIGAENVSLVGMSPPGWCQQMGL